VKAVEDVEGLGDEIGGTAEVGLPHVRTDKANATAPPAWSERTAKTRGTNVS
jgi:hypothetical protein